jgi:CRISPR-associated protein Cas2
MNMNMSAQADFTVIAFDVADDRRRRALVRVLESFGERVLESVFEAWLTPPERRRLENLALRCIDCAEDRLAFYALPDEDRKDIILLGPGEVTPNIGLWIV